MTKQLNRPASRFLRLFVIALLIALVLVLLPAPGIHSYAEIVTLPIDETGGVPPYDWGYEGDSGYKDPSISVSMERGRFEGSNWIAVKIQLQNATQLRTLKAGPYGSTQEAQGATMAKRVKSVLAIGGDFFVYHQYGYIVRQQNFYRNKLTGEHDVLIIDDKGDLQVIIRPKSADMKAFEQENKERIINAFTFGPALVKDGQMLTDMPLGRSELVRAQRIALCQTGPLSYLVVYSEGPNDPDSSGLTILEFAQLVSSFPDVVTAYNLDGGSSATIVFQGQKINGPLSQRSRSIGDIIYFASAYVGEQEPGE
ncbi:MAG: phosphodiester glycosidase family protein [Christensenellales bacterium]|jgi:exopolysaccharide biosynthesis protein|nr:phosphodiester glycosidase family protein [Clostridiales bacterium]